MTEERISVNSIITFVPRGVAELLNENANTPQNTKWHPEGCVLNHIYETVARAIDTGSPDLIMVALFHDLGKKDTLEFKDGQPTAHNHEKFSCKYVFEHRKFIEDFGANPLKVFWIVKNHMRFKRLNEMKKSKRSKLENHPWFGFLKIFGNKIDKNV